jgi:quercetin dioxygenase-like cupin family protein
MKPRSSPGWIRYPEPIMFVRKLILLAFPAVLAAQSSVTGAARQATSSGVHILQPSAMQWKTVPGYPPGYRRAMLEGETDQPVPITYRVRLPDGFRFAPHIHPWDEHVTVLEGKWHLGIGKTFDLAKMTTLEAGSFVIIPAGVPHFVLAEGQTIIQVHGLGPLGMKFVQSEEPQSH